MSKLRVFVAFMAIALVVPVVAGQDRGKPTKPPATAPCTMTGEVESHASVVTVGRDVATYGPINQALYIHESLLPSGSDGFPEAVEALRDGGADANGFFGPYYGQIRLLNDRIDYWFDTAPGCYQDNVPLCRFRAVVVDGTAVYERIGKTRTLVRIAFNDGRYLLDYRWCDPATNPDCYVKLYGCYDDRDCPGVPPGGAGYIYASFEARFQ